MPGAADQDVGACVGAANLQMTDKDIVFDEHTLTDERVALDFTILATLDALLDLDERANLRIVPDFATIEIHKIVDFDACTELDVRSNFLYP